ncbi:hypothetical protein [Oxalobacter paraformigenes]|uniref:hypothetical protein n=1 Tax=Oxalobacter paraformigenes TaxID=556268 RepID=UPI00030225DB|nr:hypothetical protein [Oxalobacter paraformigenes]
MRNHKISGVIFAAVSMGTVLPNGYRISVMTWIWMYLEKQNCSVDSRKQPYCEPLYLPEK